jgi:hypothetical protein
MSIQNLLKAPSDGRFKHFDEGEILQNASLGWARKLQDGKRCHRWRVVG